MSYKLIITAQYYENYGDSNSPHWKPKGSAEFTATVSSDMRMYVYDSDMKTAIETILAAKCNPMCRYELVGFEYVDADMPDITTELIETIQNQMNSEIAIPNEITDTLEAVLSFEELKELAEDCRYTGGNNGNVFAEFLFNNDLLHPQFNTDDYYRLASNISHTEPNFSKWITNDGFWEDFAYRAEEFGVKISC